MSEMPENIGHRKECELSFEEVSERLSYDPKTGIFVRIYSKSRKDWCGKETGRVVDNGSRGSYVRVKLGTRRHWGHRLAWLLYYGHWPVNTIDHIDGDGTNNRIENLRDVPLSENMKNKRKYKSRNTAVNPHSGVRKNARCSTWNASIRVNGNKIQLGNFRNIEEAIEARKSAEILYGFHANHGSKR